MVAKTLRVGVLCYSLTPATVELFNALHERLRDDLGGELRAFCVVRSSLEGLAPTFAFEEPRTPPRFVTAAGRRGAIPESHLVSLRLGVTIRVLKYSDVVLLFGIQGFPAVAVALAAPVLRRPVVVASQMMPVAHEVRRLRLLKWVKRIVLRLADAHVAQTTATRKVLEQVYGVSPARITLAPFTGGARTAIALLERAPNGEDARARYGIPPDALVYLFVGTLIYLKGVDLLVSAFAEVAWENPRAFLVIVGPDGGAGGMGRKIQEEVRAYGLDSRVKMLGRLPWEQVMALYKAADVLVLPTRKDTWSKVVVEAALAGRPVIISEVAGVVGTIVVDGVSGRVIRVDDRSALAGAMREMSEPSVRARMGEAARHHALRFTNLDDEANEYLRVIRTVIKDRTVGGQLPSISLP